MALTTKQNFSRDVGGVNYASEQLKFEALVFKETAWSETGGTFTSNSSSVEYSYTSEQNLFDQLKVVVENWIDDADQWNELIGIAQSNQTEIQKVSNITKQLQADVVDLQALTSTFVEAIAFANQSNYYAWTNFKNSDEEIIDETNSTVMFDVPNGVAKFDDTGNNKLVLNDYTYGSNFSEINMRLYSEELRVATPNQNYTNVNQIEVVTNDYEITNNDKLFISNIEVDITNATGGSENIDLETTPIALTTTGSRNDGGRSSAYNEGIRYDFILEGTVFKLARIEGNTSNIINAVTLTSTPHIGSIAVHKPSGKVFITCGDINNVFLRIYQEDLTFVESRTLLTDNSNNVSNIYFDINDNNGVCIYSDNNEIVRGIRPLAIDAQGSVTLNTIITPSTFASYGGSIMMDSQNYWFFMYSSNSNTPTILTNKNINTFTGIGNGLYRKASTETQRLAETNFVFEKLNGSNSTRKFWIRPDSFTYRILVSDNDFETTSTITLGAATKPSMTENISGDVIILYENSGIKSKTITNGTTSIGSEVSIRTGSFPATSKFQPEFTVPIYNYSDSGIKAGGNYTIGGGYVLTLSQNVTVTTSDNLPITTQFSPEQASSGFSFSSATPSYLQYRITGLNTTIEDIEVGGKSVDLDILTYNIF